MASIGVLMAINQAVILKKVWLRYFSEKILTLGSLLAISVAFLLISWPLMILFVTAIIISTFSQSILRITMTNHIIKDGGEKDQGELMGVLTSIMSLSAIVGPIAAGWFYGYSNRSPFILAAILSIIAYLIMQFETKHKPKEFKVDETIIESGEQKMELA
jgi:DHA1 family tetracycline resistance protein-like MFS transporter